MDPATIGIVVTLTQIGYGVGLLLLVPLGDLLNRRRLIVVQTLLSALALLMIALALEQHLAVARHGADRIAGGRDASPGGLRRDPGHPGATWTCGGRDHQRHCRRHSVGTNGGGGMADLAGWRSIYLLSAGLTLLMALLLFRVLPKHEEARPESAYGALIGSVFTLFKEEPVLRQRAMLALLTFASAMVLWTPLVLPLSAPPLSLSHTEIGLFGLAGAAGALAAARAGHLADRGLGQWTSGLSLLLMLASWLPIALTQSSLWALLLGVITLDLGLQAVHVTSQSMIYGVRPEAQSRLTAGYMLFYSIGSALGSIGSTAMYAWAGWIGVCLLGAGINAVALIYWWRTLATKNQPREMASPRPL